MKTVYEAKVSASGGRNGHVKSNDGIIDFDVRIPKSMGGNADGQTNPEQLFAAGYAACFDSALNFVAQMKKIKTGETTVTANVGLQRDEEKGFGLVVKLEVNIPGVDNATANELLQAAHETCPYSKAIKGNVEVTLSLN